MPQQGMPYGDIFSAATPALDKLGAQLYAEQKQREAKAEQDNAAADAAIQKQFSNIRTADIPDVMSSWNQYKGLKTQMLQDKTLQKDPLKYAQVQQQANEALANTYSIINGSKDVKDMHKTLVAAHAAHPDSFDDNFGTLMGTAQNLPLKQLKNTPVGDLTNPDTYAYKGTNTDFQKIEATAAGQQKPVYQPETPVDASGLQTKITPYQYGNSPAQYKESLLGAFALHKAGKDAAVAWDAIPQSEKDYVDKAFNALTPDDWLKRTGSPIPQQLVASSPDNKADQLATFKAKLYTITNEPKAGAPTFKTNEAKKFQMETDRQTKMEQLRHADAKDLVDYKKKIDPNDTQLNNLWVDKFINSINEDAKSSPLTKYYDNGKAIYEHNIPLDPTLASSLQKGGITPLYLTKMDDGRFRIIYPLKDKEGNPLKLSTGPNAGDYAIDKSLSTPITETQLAINLGKKNVTGKLRGQEINNVLNKKEPKVQDAAKKAEELLKKYGY